MAISFDPYASVASILADFDTRLSIGGTITLNTLTLSPTTATVGSAYSGTASGKTAGSALSLTGAGAAGLSVVNSTVSGTPTTAGVVNLVETLAGATNSPRTSSGALTVSVNVTLGALTLSGSLTNGTVSSGIISGATSGSSIASNVTGLSVNSGARTYSFDGSAVADTTANGLVETLAGATNSPRSTPVTVAAAQVAPLTARRSVEFGKGNGVGGQVRALTLPSISNFLRSGSAAAPGTMFIRSLVWMDALRSSNITVISSNTAVLNNSSVVLSNGARSSAGFHLEYYGSTYNTVVNRGRYVMRISGGANYDVMSAPWAADDPHVVALRFDGTQLWLDIIKGDGSILDGRTLGTPATVSGSFVGQAATAAGFLGRSSSAAGNDAQSTHRGCLSDFGYVRRNLTDAELQRIALGETPASVITDGTLSRHFRLDGPTDLAKTAGADTVADLTPSLIGSDMALTAGPSLAASHDGTRALRIDNYVPFGYVTGIDLDNPNAEHLSPLDGVTNSAGPATHIQARAVVRRDGQTVHKDWVRVTTTQLASGATLSTASLPMAKSDWVHVEIRREDAPNVVVTGFPRGVGPKIWIDGQSREAFAMRRNSTVTATLDSTVPGGESRVSFFVHRNAFGFEGRIAHGIVREKIEAGEGLKRFAKEWTARFPTQVCCLMSNAVEGQGRSFHYNNGLAGTAGSMQTWGDDVTWGTGMMTDLFLFACRGANRDITMFSQRSGSGDLGSVARYVGRMSSYYMGAARDTVGDGDTGAPPRFWTRSATNLAYGIKRIHAGRVERYPLTRDGTEATRVALAITVQGLQAQIRAFMADTTVPNKRWGGFVNDHSFPPTDELHFDDNDPIFGSANHFVRDIPAVAATLGLGTIDNNVTPPTTFTINTARDTVTMSLVAKNGGIFKTQDDRATVGGWQVTTNFTAGTPVWTDTTATLSGGNTLTFSGAWSGVANADLRFRYLNTTFPNFTYGTNGQYADKTAAIAAENAALPGHLYESHPLLQGNVSTGVLMVESINPAAPA